MHKGLGAAIGCEDGSATASKVAASKVCECMLGPCVLLGLLAITDMTRHVCCCP